MRHFFFFFFLLEQKEIIACCDGSCKTVSQIFLLSSLPWASVTTYPVTFPAAFLAVASQHHSWVPVSLWPSMMVLAVFGFTSVSWGVFTPSFGFCMQTGNSHISVSSAALTPDGGGWRPAGPSCLVRPGPPRVSVPLTDLRGFGPPTRWVCVASLHMALSLVLWPRDRADSSQFCLPSPCLQPIHYQFLSVLSV